ncbi:MAG: hypothetical protein SPI12_01800 [Actinomycetaceae bacterium]|nr:hypothetical protein [Actinomycetaceae bacterium]MDY6082582.1 hypothetical protein [Actinomycetaceae bacterium]
MSDRIMWVHEPDGETLEIISGYGDNLRRLGWHPVGEAPAVEQREKTVEHKQTAARPAKRTTKTLR